MWHWAEAASSTWDNPACVDAGSVFSGAPAPEKHNATAKEIRRLAGCSLRAEVLWCVFHDKLPKEAKEADNTLNVQQSLL